MNDTQPICSQCGAPLGDDAPRGLCPACLMKAGLPGETLSGMTESPPTAPTPEELAEQFPDLEILELLGRGGMGIVYKARQKRLDRLVALKLLSADLEQTPGFAERFTREAQALARFSHPHIVTVFDFGQTPGGRYFLLMEFVDGANLREVIQTGRVSPAEALAIVPQICDALQFAHAAGIVHRDIKPENILLDQAGRVKIADFGLAKLLRRPADAHTLTRAGTRMGSVRYMAPEQMDQPEHVDHRADIYSLGVVFYELLTGEVPMGRFAPPSQRAQIDVRLDEVVLRSLEREPERRYQSADDVRTELKSIADQPSPPPGEPAPRPPARPDGPPEKVRLPALGLQVVGGLYLVPTAYLLLCLAGFARSRSLSLVLLETVVYGLLGAACIIASRRMRELKCHNLCLAGCVLALIPFAPARMVQPLVAILSLFGMGVGIWGLYVLTRPDIQSAFARAPRPPSRKWLWVVCAASLVAMLTARDYGLAPLWIICSTVAVAAAWRLTRNGQDPDADPQATQMPEQA